MNLVNYVKGILDYSEGMKPATRDQALKETIEHYRKWEQRLIDQMQEDYRKGGSFVEFHLQSSKDQQSMLEQVIKGETTFQQEWAKICKDPVEGIKKREQDPAYARFEWTFTQFFSCFYDKIEDEARMLDDTISRLYLSKPKKKKKKRDPELWREIL